MSNATLHAIVDRLLSPDDFVRKAARTEVQGYEDAELYFILACLCWVFENSNDQLPDEFFHKDARMQGMREQYGREAVATTLDKFRDSALEEYAAPYSMRVRMGQFSAIRALYFDLQVRYEESDDELFQHLFDFLKL